MGHTTTSDPPGRVKEGSVKVGAMDIFVLVAQDMSLYKKMGQIYLKVIFHKLCAVSFLYANKDNIIRANNDQ